MLGRAPPKWGSVRAFARVIYVAVPRTTLRVYQSMTRKPDDLTPREVLVFCVLVLGLTAVAYILAVWVLPILFFR
jgi:hypothetical protein